MSRQKTKKGNRAHLVDEGQYGNHLALLIGVVQRGFQVQVLEQDRLVARQRQLPPASCPRFLSRLRSLVSVFRRSLSSRMRRLRYVVSSSITYSVLSPTMSASCARRERKGSAGTVTACGEASGIDSPQARSASYHSHLATRGLVTQDSVTLAWRQETGKTVTCR